MHLTKKIFLGVLFYSFVSISCQNSDDVLRMGNINLLLKETSSQSRTTTHDQFSLATKIFITIKRNDGTMMHELLALSLLKNGNQVMTNKIELPEGVYEITEFLVADDRNNILFLTPKEGSTLSNSVNDPLPVQFSIRSNEEQQLSIEIVSNMNESPSHFGYSTFKLSIKERILNMAINAMAPEGYDFKEAHAWIWNTRTFERKWVTLNFDQGQWRANKLMPEGSYVVEVHGDIAEPNGEYNRILLDEESFSLTPENTTLTFNHFLDRGEYIKIQKTHSTILIHNNYCGLEIGRIYLMENLIGSYIYGDRAVSINDELKLFAWEDNCFNMQDCSTNSGSKSPGYFKIKMKNFEEGSIENCLISLNDRIESYFSIEVRYQNNEIHHEDFFYQLNN